MNLLQTETGLLEADGQNSAEVVLRLLDSIVEGGTLRALNQGIVKLRECDLIDVTVDGFTVEDNSETRLENQIANQGLITVGESGANATLRATTVGAVLLGNGTVELTDAAGSVLGGPEGPLTNSAGHTIMGAGQIRGTLINEGEVLANVPGGQLSISGTDTIIANDGMLRAISGGTLLIGGTVTGSGTLRGEGGRIVIDSEDEGDIVNSGDIDVLPGSTSYLDVIGSTVNANTLTITGGITTLTAGSIVEIAGTVTICPDTDTDPDAVAVLDVQDEASQITAASFDICEGGVLMGYGSIVGDVNNNAGSVSPGGSAGILVIEGGYTQSSAGSLEIELGGLTPDRYDLLEVTGSAVLSGVLNVSYIDGFAAEPGDTFVILTAVAPLGVFETVNVPDAQDWIVKYDDVAGTVTVGVACLGDLDGDGDVDQSDLGVLLGAWGIDDGGDLDGDGQTGHSDLGVLLADWGCGT